MSKSNPFNRDVPLQFLLSGVPAIKDSLPPEIVDNAAEYKLRMDDKSMKFTAGQDDDGYFIGVSQKYRIVK